MVLWNAQGFSIMKSWYNNKPLYFEAPQGSKRDRVTDGGGSSSRDGGDFFERKNIEELREENEELNEENTQLKIALEITKKKLHILKLKDISTLIIVPFKLGRHIDDEHFTTNLSMNWEKNKSPKVYNHTPIDKILNVFQSRYDDDLHLSSVYGYAWFLLTLHDDGHIIIKTKNFEILLNDQECPVTLTEVRIADMLVNVKEFSYDDIIQRLSTRDATKNRYIIFTLKKQYALMQQEIDKDNDEISSILDILRNVSL